MKKYMLTYMGLFLAFALSAQENVFLKRDFWKGNPSITEVDQAIAEGNDPTELTSSMFDAVCYALLEKVDNKTVKHLMGIKGNEVDKLTHDGRTYIFWAAYKDNLEMMKWLVERGAKANIEDAHGYTVLNFAATTGQVNTKLYDFLLAHDANINATTHSGANALLLVAPFAEDFEIIDYFTNKGLAFDSVDDHGNGIFQYAAKGGQLAVLKALVKKGVDYKAVGKNGDNALLMAAQGTRGKQNDLSLITYLEGLGLAPDLVNKEGENALHAMAWRNTDEALYQHFIKAGVKVDQQDKEGRTPFMYACGGNNKDIVALLASHVKDMEVKDNKGRTALAWAVDRNKTEVVQVLLDQGASVHTKDKKGNTLAYYLTDGYSPRNAASFEAKWALLQKAGLKLDQPQQDGSTLLHVAAKENNMALLKRLEEFKLDINKKNAEGNTVLHLAAMSTGNTEILKYLVDQGADLSLKTEFEETVYDLAKENELLQQHETALDFLKL